MTVFVDTSALYIALDADDEMHQQVVGTLRGLLEEPLVTHSYVVAESTALVERRLGRRHARRLLTHLLAPVEVVWIDERIHRAATSAYLATTRRGPSLVDCTSFEVMRTLGLGTAFAVDRDFADAGFDVIPG